MLHSTIKYQLHDNMIVILTLSIMLESNIIRHIVCKMYFYSRYVFRVINIFIEFSNENNKYNTMSRCLVLFIANISYAFNIVTYYIFIQFLEGLPPLRWFISTFIPLFIAVWGYTKRSLSLSGALLG